MGKRQLIIHTETTMRQVMERVWELVKQGIHAGPVVITLSRIDKTREQEKKYHAMIQDIAKTVDVNKAYSFPVWKAYLIDCFETELKSQDRALRHPSQIVFNPYTHNWVTVRASTTSFLKSEGSEFIEFLYQFGAEHGAVFTEKSIEYYNECKG
jgi:hypothetical protein